MTTSIKLAVLHGYHSLCHVVACVSGWREGGGKSASLPFGSSAGNSVICKDGITYICMMRPPASGKMFFIDCGIGLMYYSWGEGEGEGD